jgi:hypothetical protein
MEGNYGQVQSVLLGVWLIGLIVYVYIAICVMMIANKTGTSNAWFAWIPILNVFLLLMIAKKPLWWIILFLIPLVNIVIAVIVWMAVAEARKKPSWLGILMLIPGLNLIIPGILAFTE